MSVAMRVGTTLTYLHSDHLGSASVSTTASGGIEWQARYKPFGETRWTSGTLTTNRKPALSEANGFNGMKEEASLGGTFGDFCEAPPNEVSGAMLTMEFILSEAKEHRDRAVLERGYDCAGGEEPAGVIHSSQTGEEVTRFVESVMDFHGRKPIFMMAKAVSRRSSEARLFEAIRKI
jgi:hypothetical protein